MPQWPVFAPAKPAYMPSMAITWMQRLKRVFNIDIEICEKCRGQVKVAAPAHPCARGINASLHVIACVEDPVAIEKILKHLKEKAVSDNTARPPPGRAAPQIELFENS